VSEISTSQTALPTFRDVWRDYVRFLRRPTLPSRCLGPGEAGSRAGLALVTIDLGAMLVLAGFAILLVGLGAQMPHHALDGIKITGMLWLLIVFVGPILEEAAFRGWLTGTPRAFGITGSIIAVGAALVLMPTLSWFATTALGAALLAGIVGSLLWLRADGASAGYQRLFPYLYWLSCLAFGLVHLTNLTIGHNRFAVLWVAPQLVLGTILGYGRVKLGMWSNILIHMLHNSIIMAVALGSGMGS
jgi:membrane protease YdiL (CAAX protease family)